MDQLPRRAERTFSRLVRAGQYSGTRFENGKSARCSFPAPGRRSPVPPVSFRDPLRAGPVLRVLRVARRRSSRRAHRHVARACAQEPRKPKNDPLERRIEPQPPTATTDDTACRFAQSTSWRERRLVALAGLLLDRDERRSTARWAAGHAGGPAGDCFFRTMIGALGHSPLARRLHGFPPSPSPCWCWCVPARGARGRWSGEAKMDHADRIVRKRNVRRRPSHDAIRLPATRRSAERRGVRPSDAQTQRRDQRGWKRIEDPVQLPSSVSSARLPPLPPLFSSPGPSEPRRLGTPRRLARRLPRRYPVRSGPCAPPCVEADSVNGIKFNNALDFVVFCDLSRASPTPFASQTSLTGFGLTCHAPGVRALWRESFGVSRLLRSGSFR